MRSIQSEYTIPFGKRTILAAFLTAVLLHLLLPNPGKALDIKKVGTQKPHKDYTLALHGVDKVEEHRFFQMKPPSELEPKHVVMLGACQISSLHWYYWPGGFDPSGRSSLPHNLEKKLHKKDETQDIYVHNFGMEGTGYAEALYFFLRTLESPGMKLYIYSISQGGDHHIPYGMQRHRKAYVKFLPKLYSLLKYYHSQYKDIPELDQYFDYVRKNPWTKAGLRQYAAGVAELETLDKSTEHNWTEDWEELLSVFDTNVLSRRLERQSRWIGVGTYNLFYQTALFTGTRREPTTKDETPKAAGAGMKPVQYYIDKFKPRAYQVKPLKFAKYKKNDRLVLRLMAALAAKKGIELWIHNPPDLAVRQSPVVNKKWWEPLKESLADLVNVRTIDQSNLPIQNGLHTGGRVAPTYYGNLRTADALIPIIERWRENLE